MSACNLDILAKPETREALLLLEVAAWLHDDFKHTDEHISKYVRGAPSHSGRQNAEDLIPSKQISLLGNSLDFKDGKKRKKNNISAGYLNRCHYAAHIEKQDADAQQTYPCYISSPFGLERNRVPNNQTQGLRDGISWRVIGKSPFTSQERNQLQKEVANLFSRVGGDTRRSSNEVTLWDWSHITAALYKAALAGALLGYQPAPNDLRWRLLSVRVDSAAFLGNSARLPDLLARQEVLTDGLDRVRTLLEETDALGTEVYRDENSSLYVVPNIPDLLSATAKGKELRTLILEEFSQGTVKNNQSIALQGEITPHVELDMKDWWAQSPNRDPKRDEIPPIGAILYKPLHSQPEPNQIDRWWNRAEHEVCPVCRLRPMKEHAEACETCLNRRGSRIEEWKKNPAQTIWIDEIADHNDRVALLVGKFGLDDWLSGDLVQTMLVRCDPNNSDPTKRFVPKNSSPARLHRVWKTCQNFWEEAAHAELNVLPQRQRWLLGVPSNSLPPEKTVCDGTLNGQPISVWRQDDRLLTISYFPEQPKIGTLRLSWETKGGKREAEYTVQTVQAASDKFANYRPTLTLLTSPGQFLALIPAAEALAVAEKIREEYGKQFGKVQNRLPLFLGIVFFQRKMPLMAAMDTARRMLGQVDLRKEETWKISRVANGQVEFANGMTLQVATTMGDGSLDNWYPYFRVQDERPTYQRCFDVKDGEFKGRWAHIAELAGKEVYVMPSRFAHFFLESTAARFQFDPIRHAMLLDELQRLRKMWQDICCKSSDMSDTRLHAIQALFESKLQEWKLGEPTVDHPITDKTFRRLVDTTLNRDNVQGVRVEDVLNGRFCRCLDLHLRVLKRRVKDEQKKKEECNEQQPKATTA